jgi:hypothetical protein
MFYRSLFVILSLFLLAILFYGFTDSDYCFGILKLFFLEWDNKTQRNEVWGVVDLVSVKYTIAWVV